MHQEMIRIRTAIPADAEALLEIYGPYIRKTAITFEYEVPGVEEFRERIRKTLENYPYLVAECDGEICGYAYTGAFVGRAACSWAVEVSIYVKEGMQKMGIGKRLYQMIEEISRHQNIRNLNASIACPDTEDEYLTKNSIQFHEHLGYRMVGQFHRCGYKFGRWYDLAWVEKIIGLHDDPAPFLPFPNLDPEHLNKIYSGKD